MVYIHVPWGSRKKVSLQILDIWIFSNFRGPKSWKNDHFERFWQKIVIFSTFRPPKIGKIQIFKICIGNFFSITPGYMYTNFQVNWSIFQTPDTIFVKSQGTNFFPVTDQKMPFFGQKKANFSDFWAKFLEFIKTIQIHVLSNFGLYWMFFGPKMAIFSWFWPNFALYKSKGILGYFVFNPQYPSLRLRS